MATIEVNAKVVSDNPEENEDKKKEIENKKETLESNKIEELDDSGFEIINKETSKENLMLDKTPDKDKAEQTLDDKNIAKVESNSDSEDVNEEKIQSEQGNHSDKATDRSSSNQTVGDKKVSEVESNTELNDDHEEEVNSDQENTDQNCDANKEEVPKASLVDIKIIKEAEEKSENDSPPSEDQTSEDLEEALKKVPDLSSSVSDKILTYAGDENDVKEIIEDIEQKTEQRPEGTLIDITIIEETGKENNVQEVIQSAESSFEAEVIEDDADIKISAENGEDVVECNISYRSSLICLSLSIAIVSVIIAVFVYHLEDIQNELDDEIIEEQIEIKEPEPEPESWFWNF